VALLAALLAIASLIGAWSPRGDTAAPVRVLLITAHPDDETMLNMGRFLERGWQVSIALVTNGEHGQVVQRIDETRDSDVLVEQYPGADTWVMKPPLGPPLRRIATVEGLARERQSEFLASQSRNGVSTVYFLSDPAVADYADGWDIGVTTWDRDLLVRQLQAISARTRPDIVITLNPDESWAHPQHQGLGRIVRSMHGRGDFDSGGLRPPLYAIRENAWYQESTARQPGDERYSRVARSPLLGRTYAQYWADATSAYVSQSSHPVWFAARVRAGILPGYRGYDVIRRLDHGAQPGLDQLYAAYPPNAVAMASLPRVPKVGTVTR
jgi:LmbE family N-acetylglucosaminyl deacetylase